MSPHWVRRFFVALIVVGVWYSDVALKLALCLLMVRAELKDTIYFMQQERGTK